MADEKDDQLEDELETTIRYRKTLDRSTEVKKYQVINEIKNMGEEIKKNPLKVEFVHIPWYKKILRSIKGFFTKFRA